MIEKRTNYSAIVEMANTEGFREIEKMLDWDVRFSQGLLGRPRTSDTPTKENPHPKGEYIKDMHDIGYARGILYTAQKYLSLVKTARIKTVQ